MVADKNRVLRSHAEVMHSLSTAGCWPLMPAPDLRGASRVFERTTDEKPRPQGVYGRGSQFGGQSTPRETWEKPGCPEKVYRDKSGQQVGTFTDAAE
jgi:hypothetical protein